MFAPGRKRTCAFPRVMVAQIDEARLLKGNDEYASGGASLHQECCQFTNECWCIYNKHRGADLGILLLLRKSALICRMNDTRCTHSVALRDWFPGRSWHTGQALTMTDGYDKCCSQSTFSAPHERNHRKVPAARLYWQLYWTTFIGQNQYPNVWRGIGANYTLGPQPNASSSSKHSVPAHQTGWVIKYLHFGCRTLLAWLPLACLLFSKIGRVSSGVCTCWKFDRLVDVRKISPG